MQLDLLRTRRIRKKFYIYPYSYISNIAWDTSKVPLLYLIPVKLLYI